MSFSAESALPLVPFHPLVNPIEFENLSIILLIVGFFMMSYFFIYQITYTKKNRSITKELVIGIFASMFLALGTFFLFLSVGFNL